MFAISRKTGAVLALVLASAAIPALAQNGGNSNLTDRLLACDRISDRLEELACYDAIVESLPAGEPVEATTSESAASAESTPVAKVAVVPAVIVADTIAETAASTASQTRSMPVPATVTGEDDVVTNNAATEGAAQQEVKKKKKFETFQATIVDVWRTADDRFAVKLDNGQTWRETAGSRITIPKKGWTVEVTKAGFGGYRMKIENRKRLASVKLQD